jgi:hypothetical protein
MRNAECGLWNAESERIDWGTGETVMRRIENEGIGIPGYQDSLRIFELDCTDALCHR